MIIFYVPEKSFVFHFSFEIVLEIPNNFKIEMPLK